MMDNLSYIDSLNHSLALELRAVINQNTIKSQDNDVIIIEDVENILQAIKAKLNLIRVYTTDKNKLSSTLMQNLPSSLPISEISPRTCKKIFASTRKPNIFATAKLPKPLSLDSFFIKSVNDILVLDNLAITGNVGAIIRTATAFNSGGLIFLDTDYTAIYDRRIIRSSRGYLFNLPLISVSTNEFIAFANAKQLNLATTAADGKTKIDEIKNLNQRLAIILGSEKQGVSAELKKNALWQIQIPISTTVESLNVSVVAGIILYLRNLYKS